MGLERAVTLSADLMQRRADLIRLFGDERYRERTALAKERIKEVMAQQNAPNPLSAAVAYCRHLAAKHPRALAIDCDVTPGSSTRAKIEAFLELSGIEPARRSPA